MVNAVIDALAHEGVTHIDMPATPWKVWQAIQNARNGTDGAVGHPARTMGAS